MPRGGHGGQGSINVEHAPAVPGPPPDAKDAMTDQPYSTLLDEALEAWEDVRRGTLEEANVIPDRRWDFRPHPESRSVDELVRHILESALMMVGELSREDGDFTRQSYPEHIAEHAAPLPRKASPDQLRDLLASTFGEGVAKLRAAGELHMLQYIRRFDGQPGTRLAWLHHGVAHEMYHRGQLALYARQMDVVPALTRRIRGEG